LHSAIEERAKSAQLPKLHINTLLVLPDHTLAHDIVAYPRERIVDAPSMGQLTVQLHHLAHAKIPLKLE